MREAQHRFRASRRESGRVSLLGVAGLVAFVLMIGLFFAARESLSTVGSRFMTAWCKADEPTLTKMSFMGDLPAEEISKRWKKSLDNAKYVHFTWVLVGSEQLSDDEGTVRLKVTCPSDSPSSYDQSFQLKMLRVKGDWKVDIQALPRDIIPMIPRAN